MGQICAASLKCLLMGLSVLLLSATSGIAEESTDIYQQVLKPILRDRCFACHGALKQEAGLRLDTAMSMRQGGDSGGAVEPGNAGASLIVLRTESQDAATRMPPEGEPLKPAEIAALRDWIAAGAIAPAGEQSEEDPREHWAFRTPVRPPLPTDIDAGWVQT
ncbi:MAG: c-type cytochrome domain-containing protein, partial [Planctomyces sp.]